MEKSVLSAHEKYKIIVAYDAVMNASMPPIPGNIEEIHAALYSVKDI